MEAFLIPFIIICVHYVADFIFQAEEWANNKSKSNSALFKHVITYSSIWVLPACLLLGYVRHNETTEWYVYSTLLFFILTFLQYSSSYVVGNEVAKKRSYKK